MNLTPSAFADLDDAPSQEIGLLLERAAAEADPRTLKRATALLLDRALRRLREGSRDSILEEALAVSRGISGEAGRALRKRSLDTFGAWTALDDLLAEAGRRSDRAAVPSLLRGTQGRGQEILEMLAGEAGPVPRSRIKNTLDLGEAHLSHLLRDLEEADLILRYRRQGSKEVLVELGPAGREVVSESILPPWLARLEQALQDAAAGGTLEHETLARELASAGAPSRLAADRLARAVAQFSTVNAAVPQVKKEAVIEEEGAPASAVLFVGGVEKLREGGALDFKERSAELRERRGQRRQSAAWAKQKQAA